MSSIVRLKSNHRGVMGSGVWLTFNFSLFWSEQAGIFPSSSFPLLPKESRHIHLEWLHLLPSVCTQSYWSWSKQYPCIRWECFTLGSSIRLTCSKVSGKVFSFSRFPPDDFIGLLHHRPGPRVPSWSLSWKQSTGWGAEGSSYICSFSESTQEPSSCLLHGPWFSVLKVTDPLGYDTNTSKILCQPHVSCDFLIQLARGVSGRLKLCAVSLRY